MATPSQRIADLESGAWQAERHLERIDATLGEMTSKLDQHGIALSDTMQDLRDLRIDVHGITKTQRDHGRELRHHTAILTAIATHLGVPVPEPEEDAQAAPETAAANEH